jgi:hypothetical protein
VKQPKPAETGRPGWLLPAIIVAVIAVVGAVLAVVLGNQTPPYEAEVTGAPSAVVDTTVVDHGAVPYAQTVESVYRVRNVGDEPLVILGEPRVELVEGC